MKLEVKDSEVIKNLLTIVAGLVFLAFYADNDLFAYVGLGLGLVGLIIPPAGKMMIVLWFKLAEVLGWINSRVLLILMYVLFLLPMSIIYKIGKRNALFLNKKVEDTYYETRNHAFTKADIEKTW